MRPELDLTQRHFVVRRGIMTMIGTWMRYGRDYEPGAVLVRTGEEYSDYTVPYFIATRAGAIWLEDSADPQAAMFQAIEIVDHLRLTMGAETLRKVQGFITEHLDYLMTMPPRPPLVKPLPILGEARLTDRNTGRTIELEIPYV